MDSKNCKSSFVTCKSVKVWKVQARDSQTEGCLKVVWIQNAWRYSTYYWEHNKQSEFFFYFIGVVSVQMQIKCLFDLYKMSLTNYNEQKNVVTHFVGNFGDMILKFQLIIRTISSLHCLYSITFLLQLSDTFV